MPLVSVIIPNYRHADYLAQRIDSVLNQTLGDFEVIILDDCSPDNSREVIAKYASHSKVAHIVYNTQNSGSTFKQWRKGIELAQGKYIWIAESDDWADATFLEKLVVPMEHNQQAGISYCLSYLYYNHELSPDIYKADDAVRVFTGQEFLTRYQVVRNTIYNASMAVFRKELYYKIPFEQCEQCRYGGDYLFWTLLLQYCDIIQVNERLNFFRKHNQNVTTGALATGLNIVEGYRTYESIVTTYDVDCSILIKTKLLWAQRWAGIKYRKGINYDIFRLFLKKDKVIIVLFPIAWLYIKFRTIILRRNVYFQ